MKIKNILAVFIIVGGISYALYCSLITDFLLKYGETIHTKAVVEEKLTGKVHIQFFVIDFMVLPLNA